MSGITCPALCYQFQCFGCAQNCPDFASFLILHITAQKFKQFGAVRKLSEEYKNGNLDLREMNQSMRHLLADTKRLAAANRANNREVARANKKSHRPERGIGVGGAGLALAGVAGLGALGLSMASGATERAIQLQAERQEIQQRRDKFRG